jgi:hypothetical protein
MAARPVPTLAVPVCRAAGLSVSDCESPWRTIRSGTLWARCLRSRPTFRTS